MAAKHSNDTPAHGNERIGHPWARRARENVGAARGGYERGLAALQQIGFGPAKDAVHVGHEMSCLLSLAQARSHTQALFGVIDHPDGLCFDVPGRLHQRLIL
jgi:hypothetical protein